MPLIALPIHISINSIFEISKKNFSTPNDGQPVPPKDSCLYKIITESGQRPKIARTKLIGLNFWHLLSLDIML